MENRAPTSFLYLRFHLHILTSMLSGHIWSGSLCYVSICDVCTAAYNKDMCGALLGLDDF